MFPFFIKQEYAKLKAVPFSEYMYTVATTVNASTLFFYVTV
jgi:hypothetical protein